MMLITGSTGFIGTHLIKELSKDYKIRCLYRKKFESIKNTEPCYGDILNKDSLEKAFYKINLVIHLAALREGKPKEIIKTNLEGTKNLIDLSKKNNVKRFIFLSTANVLLKNKGPYTISKLAAERTLINSGLSYIIVRPNWVYDCQGNKDLKNIISLIKKYPLIPIMGNGKYKTQPLYINDLIKAIKFIIKDKKIKNKIYSIGGDEKISFNELIDEIVKDLNLKKKKVHIPLLLVKFFSPLIKISKERITEITQDKDSNNKEVIKDFNFKPISIKQFLSKIIK